ncbi:hypothetical protein KAFR_0I01790 [Kazachstania africana CBS 2517]|uniref:Uncharacterized protein n=1 Tax=Kazachstania africana (strain ATCC 22294 / BCRC 22015 / CBS 2517 / CECT 1963 / NBRC 1671 / NRRL Y-8276) TaxID=1071382 RepID=H2B010_KAZAF|nr:hypothetical protein KAFR_0I01790 [Kazachstania africana CBS 2517]CCF59960.1 hypothetical protein KAFR_0I01790 [Kazachstania africana CBS 2517]
MSGVTSLPTAKSSSFITYRLNKYSVGSSGTTNKIREQLGFRDDIIWRRFSNRRLELIDKFNLSHFKASEQDQNIRRIAAMLREEFGYPESTSNEFEKLVTAAVQSVRRNRKRAMRKRAAAFKAATLNGNHFNMPYFTSPSANDPIWNNALNYAAADPFVPNNFSVLSQSPPGGLAVYPLGYQSYLPSNMVEQPYNINALQSTNRLPQKMFNENPNYQFINHRYDFTNFPPMNGMKESITSTQIPLAFSVNIPGIPTNPTACGGQGYDGIIRRAMSDVMNAYFLLSGPGRKCDEETVVRERVCHSMKNSKQCHNILNSAEPLKHFEHLRVLGETAIKKSAAEVMKRHFQTGVNPSIEPILTKTGSSTWISNLSLKLFSPVVRMDLSQFPMFEVQIELLYLSLGCIVHDFGYDDPYIALNNLIYNELKDVYTIHENNNTDGNSISCKIIKAAYNGDNKEFNFSFSKNRPLTIVDVLERFQSLFGMRPSNINHLAMYYQNKIVLDDFILSEILKADTESTLSIEIIDLNKEPVLESQMPVGEKIYSYSSLSSTAPSKIAKKITIQRTRRKEPQCRCHRSRIIHRLNLL